MDDPTDPTPSDAPQVSFEDLLRNIAEAQRSRHRSEGMIARGGMGTIERVHDRSLDRRVALKRIHPMLESNPSQAVMFVREARVTGQLQHPAIVPVHELGVDPEGHLYYTMERVEGRTLEEEVLALPPGGLDRSRLFDLLEVVVKVCDALAYAHSGGVLHCDVKPANVMVGSHGRVYLMDWGIARYLAEERARDPGVPGTIAGTPSWMAPEQARAEPIDERADVFAAGSLIYFILTRRPPFLAEEVVQSLLAACLCNFPHPDQVPTVGRAPAALTRIVLRAMAPRPEERFASVSELREALVRFMRGVDSFPRVSFLPGEHVVVEGEQGDEAYVIESGRCEVHREVDGRRTVIRTMGPGEVFGEMAVLSPGARTASVTALEETTLLCITAQTLQAEVDSMKPWMGALVRTLAERFREREATR